MVAAVTSKGMYQDEPSNKGLWNVFANKEATPDQAHDLLNFRSIGQEAFEQVVF